VLACATAPDLLQRPISRLLSLRGLGASFVGHHVGLLPLLLSIFSSMGGVGDGRNASSWCPEVARHLQANFQRGCCSAGNSSSTASTSLKHLRIGAQDIPVLLQRGFDSCLSYGNCCYARLNDLDLVQRTDSQRAGSVLRHGIYRATQRRGNNEIAHVPVSVSGVRRAMRGLAFVMEHRTAHEALPFDRWTSSGRHCEVEFVRHKRP
jgi:hypothetical protein